MQEPLLPIGLQPLRDVAFALLRRMGLHVWAEPIEQINLLVTPRVAPQSGSASL